MTRIVRTGRRRPRKLTLSPTKIGTYLACRLMYKLTYIDRLSRFYYRPKSYHSFGGSLHKALEEYHKLGGPQTQSAEQLVDRMRQAWVSAGYASEQEEREHLESAAQFLQHYHTTHRIEGVTTLLTEKPLKLDMGEFNLMGRIDKIDEHPDGHLEVIDYKSGRLSVEEDEVRNDLAIRIYAYLARGTYPDRGITAGIYCLASGEKATVEFSDEEFTQIEDELRAVASEIAQVDEDSEIGPVWLEDVCPECDYLRLCARKAGWNSP